MAFVFYHGDILSYILFKLLLAKNVNVNEKGSWQRNGKNFGWLLISFHYCVSDKCIHPFCLTLQLNKANTHQQNKSKPLQYGREP